MVQGLFDRPDSIRQGLGRSWFQDPVVEPRGKVQASGLVYQKRNRSPYAPPILSDRHSKKVIACLKLREIFKVNRANRLPVRLRFAASAFAGL